MKIADVSEFYSPTGGGVRAYVHQKLAFAARFGHQLTIVAPGGETRTEAVAGGAIAWVKSPLLPFDRNYRMFWGAAEVWRVLDELSPDLVEGSSPWRGGWIAARWPGSAARVLFMHSDPVASYPLLGWLWPYLRRLNAPFDATVVTGAWLARRLAAHGLARIETIPLGVDRGLFRPDHRDPQLRRALLAQCGLGEEAALLIAVGRHHPEKRLGLLINAVTQAQRQRPIGLTIIGDGLSRDSVEARAARARHVRVAGPVHDRQRLAGIMASADALLHGCGSETFGLAVAEALCSGTPVIVPDSGGAADLAASGGSEIYSAGDAAAAADAILSLLARDRAQLSRAALANAQARISSVEQHFENLFRFYETLIKSP